MIISGCVSSVECQQEQPAALEDKIVLLTAEIEALRTKLAAVESSLASLKAATGKLALSCGARSALLREFGMAEPVYLGVPMK
jgi:chromosome segregation ATPase